eukprot:scaffold3720_cov401-Prasinococcus_capsulatus_cf.AAC.6
MTRALQTKGWLELFKFGLYITVPIGMVGAFVYNPDNLNRVVKSFHYVSYPPEPEVPRAEQIANLLQESKQEQKRLRK